MTGQGAVGRGLSRLARSFAIAFVAAFAALAPLATVASLVELPPAECGPLNGLGENADAIALWHLDEGLGPLAIDASANGNHGLVAGAARIASPHACALAFDAADHRVTVQDAASLDVNGPLTISAWLRLRSHGDGIDNLVGKGDAFRLGVGGIAVGGEPLEVLRVTYMFRPGATFTTHSVGEVSLGAWTHVAVTIDAANVRFYVGGALDTSIRSEGAVAGNDVMPLILGAQPGVQVPHLDLDEVALIGRALDAGEIAALAAG